MSFDPLYYECLKSGKLGLHHSGYRKINSVMHILAWWKNISKGANVLLLMSEVHLAC